MAFPKFTRIYVKFSHLVLILLNNYNFLAKLLCFIQGILVIKVFLTELTS